ncbi:hypothetical protein DL771_003978 [Monosporascus sp. 5C6A]|nr:hypothetical protein DL771_003978 [Monosporascus sp. 5C6A]
MTYDIVKIRDPHGLSNRLSDVQQSEFLDSLWGGGSYDQADYPYYFAWLRDRITQYCGRPHKRVEVRTYGGVITLVRFIKHRMNITLDDIVSSVLDDNALLQVQGHVVVWNNVRERDIVAAIEFAISVWSMITLGGSTALAGVTVWRWPLLASLNSTLEGYLTGHDPDQGAPMPDHLLPLVVPDPEPVDPDLEPVDNEGPAILADIPQQDPDGDELDVDEPDVKRDIPGPGGNPPNVGYDREFTDYFTLCGMNRLVGFQIQWTSNLLDHLRLRKLRANGFSTYVYVFHHAAVLERIGTGGPKVARKFAWETRRTLGMLVPYGLDPPRPWLWSWRWTRRWTWGFDDDRDHREWFVENSGADIDKAAALQAALSWRKDDYHCWRSRLLKLEEEYEMASARTPIQWWRDKRRRGQWLTLWIAIAGAILAVLALFLTFLSTVTGIISAREAVVANLKDDEPGGVLEMIMAGNGTAAMSGCCFPIENSACPVATGGNNTSVMVKTEVDTVVETSVMTLTVCSAARDNISSGSESTSTDGGSLTTFRTVGYSTTNIST